MVALRDRKAKNIGELSFKKGEYFEIIGEQEHFWSYARSVKTGCEGFIPSIKSKHGWTKK